MESVIGNIFLNKLNNNLFSISRIVVCIHTRTFLRIKGLSFTYVFTAFDAGEVSEVLFSIAFETDHGLGRADGDFP